MNNATPATPHDEYSLTVQRPAGITNERWKLLRNRIEAEAAPVVSEILGVCPDRSWCRGLAGIPEHAEYHASMLYDLVDSKDPSAPAAAAAYVVERRTDEALWLVVDIEAEVYGHAHELELDAAAARDLLQVTLAGASTDPGDDARQRILDLIEEAI